MSINLKRTAAAATIAVAAVLSGSAVAQNEFVGNAESTAETCFRVQDVRNYVPVTVGERDAVNLRVRNHGYYQAELLESCPGVDDAIQIAIRAETVTGQICTGADATLVAFSRIAPPVECAVSGLRKMSEAQVASLPLSEKP
jgi:hypothetical protein